MGRLNAASVLRECCSVPLGIHSSMARYRLELLNDQPGHNMFEPTVCQSVTNSKARFIFLDKRPIPPRTLFDSTSKVGQRLSLSSSLSPLIIPVCPQARASFSLTPSPSPCRTLTPPYERSSSWRPGGSSPTSDQPALFRTSPAPFLLSPGPPTTGPSSPTTPNTSKTPPLC